MDVSRMHPQARAALGVQLRVPLTVDNLPAARRSMTDAAPAEVGAGPQLRSVVDVDAGGVPARLYRAGDGEQPVLLYAHGGGWVMGDLTTHDGLCRAIAAASGWAVLAVDYRLAPEFPYPAALDDVDTALSWLREAGASAFGLDPDRIAVGGDSAGGHIAAVAARRARDAGRPFVAQVLICPVVDPVMDYPDLDEFGLHRDEMWFFWEAIAPAGTDRAHPDLDPLRADPTGLPPALVITAELDVLAAEAERYAARLMHAGVPVVSTRYQGLIHNFPRKLALFDAAPVAVAQIAEFLSRLP
jgi:acetyl esterase